MAITVRFGFDPPPIVISEPAVFVNWNSGTGNSPTAVMDLLGDHPFEVSACEHTDVMSVVTGVSRGWGATPNVLAIACQGETRCWQVEQVATGIPINTSWYPRVYFMMPTGGGAHHDLNHPNVHGFSSGIATWLGLSDVGASDYRVHIQYGDFISADTRWFRQYASPKLTRGTWYRYAWFNEVFGVHPYDSSLRAWRIHPQIFSVTNAATGDLSGTLLYDETNFIHRDLDMPSNTLALLHSPAGASGWPADPHDGDEFWGAYHPTLFDHVAELRSLGVGAEGPGGAGVHLGSPAILCLAGLHGQLTATSPTVYVGPDIWNPTG